ncbi:VanZ family protein [Bacillus sp. ISL-47]|uniref:VanZ family protein n=1 Tax=Bacillus sp. ISL-47 TaxID=2819130 RepID=UPI001BE62756|nr:VanZ family protein [Bacillus sp. ISL-47]MBT2687204.1 VanZ family protein [Bacillus sp. ISL-47]MBT2709804.1 VanZ family protein [Pseudomonas sp. ISL-84]
MLRQVILIGWAGVIFICTCVASIETAVETMSIQFFWTPEPPMKDLLQPLPANLSTAFLLRKAGHAFVFFIFTMALYLVHPSVSLNVLYSFVYAVITEFLQLFFMRDGRLFDVAFDSLGIFTAVLLIVIGRRFLKINNEMKINT